MENFEKLYETFGELLYVVAMSDGLVQEEELSALNKIVDNHPYGKSIKWSFSYEMQKKNSLDYLYKKVLDFCYYNGPSAEYQQLLRLLEEVAIAANGLDEAENKVINSFSSELLSKFKADLENKSLL